MFVLVDTSGGESLFSHVDVLSDTADTTDKHPAENQLHHPFWVTVYPLLQLA